MVIEHPHVGDPYDAAGMWSYKDAQCEYVATAVWQTVSAQNGPFDGPSRHKKISRIRGAESDNLEELDQWGQVQIANGAAWVRFSETWIITDGPERFRGLRDNRPLMDRSLIGEEFSTHG